jgi:hypothetical protein
VFSGGAAENVDTVVSQTFQRVSQIRDFPELPSIELAPLPEPTPVSSEGAAQNEDTVQWFRSSSQLQDLPHLIQPPAFDYDLFIQFVVWDLFGPVELPR